MTPLEQVNNIVHSLFPSWQVYYYAIPEEVIDDKSVTNASLSH